MDVGASLDFDFQDPDCPSRRALDLISDTWTPRVVWALTEGTLRYNELRRRIPGISQRMLTRSLRKLEDEMLITRTVHDTIPPMVDYTLSPTGMTFVEPLVTVALWGDRMLAKKGKALARGSAKRTKIDC